MDRATLDKAETELEATSPWTFHLAPAGKNEIYVRAVEIEDGFSEEDFITFKVKVNRNASLREIVERTRAGVRAVQSKLIGDFARFRREASTHS